MSSLFHGRVGLCQAKSMLSFIWPLYVFQYMSLIKLWEMCWSFSQGRENSRPLCPTQRVNGLLLLGNRLPYYCGAADNLWYTWHQITVMLDLCLENLLFPLCMNLWFQWDYSLWNVSETYAFRTLCLYAFYLSYVPCRISSLTNDSQMHWQNTWHDDAWGVNSNLRSTVPSSLSWWILSPWVLTFLQTCIERPWAQFPNHQLL